MRVKGRTLEPAQIRHFVEAGFVRVDDAFSRALADAARDYLWRGLLHNSGCGRDPATWTHPVIRLGDYAQEPFRLAVNTPRLYGAFDELVGVGRWQPRGSLGTFPIRFPSDAEPGDDGWHVDASFAGEKGEWRINVVSRGRALLMLFLFSDVGDADAPTRIRVGSHRDVAKLLAPAGECGLEFMELARLLDVTAERPEALATGAAGTVYLCHPFLVHAAQKHRGGSGSQPRFVAQPPLPPALPLRLQRDDRDYSPVEAAIRLGLGRD
jgi:hypothetical protein